MIPLGFVLERGDLPCTVYYREFTAAVRRHPWYRDRGAALAIPAEDTANQQNWPLYGDPDAAYRGGAAPDESTPDRLAAYWTAIVAYAMAHADERVLVLNMDPFRRLADALQPFSNLILADSSLTAGERQLNPRTISMPVPTFVRPAATPPVARPHLVSFQGAPSHPVRAALADLHDGRDVIVRSVDRSRHVGRIDGERAAYDAEYEGLLDRSVFAFVPRGDAVYSHRLLEAMARGAVPVVLADGWVLPFDRSVSWAECSISIPEAAAADALALLRRFSDREIRSFQANVRRVYDSTFASLDAVVAALVQEAVGLAA